MAKNIKDNNKIIPAICTTLTYFASIALPRIASTNKTTKCPPSKAGIGNKFITPKFKLNNAANCNNGNKPKCAAD